MDVIIRSLVHECSSRKMNRNALINKTNDIFLPVGLTAWSKIFQVDQLVQKLMDIFNVLLMQSSLIIKGKNKNVAVWVQAQVQKRYEHNII